MGEIINFFANSIYDNIHQISWQLSWHDAFGIHCNPIAKWHTDELPFIYETGFMIYVY